MSYHAASLTPSRPAPQAPQRRADPAPTYGSNPTLAALGYSSSFKLPPPSPSGSSYAFPYSGIGGSPIRGQDLPIDSQIVRLGWVSMKDDSFGFGNWIFQRKWLVLKESSLSIHKNEVSCRKYLWVLASLINSISASCACLVIFAPKYHRTCGRDDCRTNRHETILSITRHKRPPLLHVPQE